MQQDHDKLEGDSGLEELAYLTLIGVELYNS
jgi:hypothetical protein